MRKMITKCVFIGFLLLQGYNLSAEEKKIVILHTNDTHSQIEPNAINAAQFADKGGVLRRSAYINQVRSTNPHALLFDSGDIVQGTPYYNFFEGNAEIKLMNQLNYDVATLGNHEFDNGIGALVKMLKLAKFPIVSSNYDVSKTELKDYIKTHLIIERNGLKIGVIGLTIDPYGLIAKKNYAGIKYLDPIETANFYAKKLKEQGCDLIIALSHLGYYESPMEMGDVRLAENTRFIDIILGGHTHTYLKECVEKRNLDGNLVRIAQVGKSGFYVGRLDVTLDKQ